jgi:cytochrome c1
MNAGGRTALFVCMALVAGCESSHVQSGYTVATEGDARRGAGVIRDFGCGACHTIPGIRAANGVVGPPLYFFSRRTFIAGELPNTPANLVRWVQDPPSVEPMTAMPKLGLSDQQARDVAAYLYTLR